MKFGKYYRALDHVIVAMNSMGAGKPVLAAKHLQQAMKCKDFEQVIAVLDEANDVKAVAQPKAKPTLAQALTIVAAKAKPKKKAGAKKPFGGKQAPPFKKKAKANTLVISEVDLDGDDGLTEDDLLLDDDEMVDDTGIVEDDTSGEDLDLDSLSLDDDAEEMADFDIDGDGDIDLDGDGDVLEMPEATSAETDDDGDDDAEDDESEEEANVESAAKPKKKAGAKKPFGGKQAPPFKKKVKAEALGTDEEIRPGSDGVPAEEDVSETDTEPKSGVDAESQVPENKATTTAAARRLLSNLSVLEQQSVTAQAKATAQVKK